MLNNGVKPELWVKQYGDYLFQFAIKRISGHELCKDLVQDTFLSAIKSLSTFNGRSTEKTWLTSILKNKIIDYYRKSIKESGEGELKTIGEYQPDYFEENGHWKKIKEPETWGIEEENSLANQELENVLKECLQKLPKQWALVFNLKYMDEEDSDKICKELNITPSNFWVIIHRSKLSLRACISKHWQK